MLCLSFLFAAFFCLSCFSRPLNFLCLPCYFLLPLLFPFLSYVFLSSMFYLRACISHFFYSLTVLSFSSRLSSVPVSLLFFPLLPFSASSLPAICVSSFSFDRRYFLFSFLFPLPLLSFVILPLWFFALHSLLLVAVIFFNLFCFCFSYPSFAHSLFSLFCALSSITFACSFFPVLL